jgi:CRP-like cAMP-binding protein
MNIFHNYLDYFTYKEYLPNTVVFSEGDKCENICLIIKGEVEISTCSFNENQYSIVMLTNGNLFGEYLIFSNAPFYMGNVIAMKETQIGFLSKAKLISLLLSNSSFMVDYLNALANQHLLLQNKIKILTQKTIREKIMFYLNLTAKQKHCKTIQIKSKEKFALFLNVPRPSLSRELIHLKKDGFLDFNRYTITIK